MERVASGERLSTDVLDQLEIEPDLHVLGMLADATRRRLHGNKVTYLRVAHWGAGLIDSGVPAGSKEIRITDAPSTLTAAVKTVERVRVIAGERAVVGFAWADVARFATEGNRTPMAVLRELRQAGLDGVDHVALDMEDGANAALELLAESEYQQLRVGVDRLPSVKLFSNLAEFQDRFSCIQSLCPLPRRFDASQPTTGYQDIRAVALARLAAPNVPTIQLDWRQYGPKLAQVALTFGVDDLDGVSPSDEAPEGRRRAPVEDIRRNVAAAGLEAVERDGRFGAVV
jgi:aminodeoxyfutalosine synthase